MQHRDPKAPIRLECPSVLNTKRRNNTTERITRSAAELADRMHIKGKYVYLPSYIPVSDYLGKLKNSPQFKQKLKYQ